MREERWDIYPGQGTFAIYPADKEICEVDKIAVVFEEHHAHLINAAPQMLEALEEAAGMLENMDYRVSARHCRAAI